SDAAYQQIRDKLDVTVEDAGEQQLKNIARPVRVYRVLVDGPKARSLLGFAPLKRKRATALVLAGVFVLLAIGGGATWGDAGRHEGIEPLRSNGEGRPLLARPTVAVLPFLTPSTGPAHDYFGDGLTEDIISALGRFPELAVLARNTVFPYKGKQLGSEELGRILGARYLVEGSLRRSSEHIRVSVQLADASNGALLWSAQYDAEPKDIFSIQDTITRQVVGAL